MSGILEERKGVDSGSAIEETMFSIGARVELGSEYSKELLFSGSQHCPASR